MLFSRFFSFCSLRSVSDAYTIARLSRPAASHGTADGLANRLAMPGLAAGRGMDDRERVTCSGRARSSFGSDVLPGGFFRGSSMRLLAVIVAVSSWLAVADHALASMVFNLKFDATFDQTFSLPVLPPSLGTGTISFDDTLADGTYFVSTLTNFAFTATLNGQTWTMADLVSNPAPLAITIFTKMKGRDIYFDGPGQAPNNGSATFVNSGGYYLATEPNNLGPPSPHDLWIAGFGSSSATLAGNYGVYPVPEPATWSVFAIYLLGMAGSVRRCLGPCASSPK